ncbi:protein MICRORCHIDIA 7 isoform X2 [Dendrobium catenatum]|uniref:protein MICRORCHIDIA 7 isoform X2 n=1 Tax=Dendrobium catenatum TaxID=906689 RepID=UPI0010A00351|nr:protein MICRORCHIDIA 7 isoform X2 [Dendrobium catenatum]
MMEETTVKIETEPLERFDRPLLLKAPPPLSGDVAVIDLSSSGSDSEVETEKRSRASDGDVGASKKRKLEGRMLADLPPGFLDPLPSSGEKSMRPSLLSPSQPVASKSPALRQGSRQFWKAGDFESLPVVDDSTQFSLGMDHVRVHPRFLHSNATSHKWALGAFAELLDNSLDEVCNGATFVSIDMLTNKKDGTKMLLIEDDGGGMNPDKMRQCMSLGYSKKSKIANCIGQYGNGFKTSTMRLGADAIVFSVCRGEGKSPTRSIGMLSYTFLRDTGKEDIVVPMLDYEKRGQCWEKMMSSSAIDWNKNVDIIVQWSPYSCEADLLQQFDLMQDHGTRIVIYNLWEDDLGKLELDFDTDKHDIQISGVNRDEKKIQMAKQFPNSKHFLTYRHSLRSYTSILYLRLPNGFRMILRGEEIEHHNIVNDMMLKQENTYRPNPGTDKVPKDPNLVAVVTIGFVKDAKHHIDVQGFNVYHKNRLIKPFWRVWNAAGSDGRGVIEANFVEPAHDKQGFERTTVLSRLESRLILMQKKYWSSNCHKVGYAPRIKKRNDESEDNDSSPEVPCLQSSQHPKKGAFPNKVSNDSRKYQYSGKHLSNVSKKGKNISSTESAKAGFTVPSKENGTKSSEKFGKSKGSSVLRTHELPYERNERGSGSENIFNKGDNLFSSVVPNVSPTRKFSDKEGNCSELLSTSPSSLKCNSGGIDGRSTRSQTKAASQMLKEGAPVPDVNQSKIKQLEDENDALKRRLKTVEESMLLELQHERNRNKTLVDQAASQMIKEGAPFPEVNQSKIKQLEDENDALKRRLKTVEESMLLELQHERNRNKTLIDQLEEEEKKLEESNKEQEALIDIFSEERTRRDEEEATLRKRLKDAQDEIRDLLEKLAAAKD